MKSNQANAPSKKMLWTGRILSGLAVLFMLMDGVMKLFKPSFVVEASAQMGYGASTLPGIGCVLIFCTILYVLPGTSILGAVLLTGYLGGAVASQVRIGADWFSVAFPVLFGALIWSSLWMRDRRLQNLFSFSGRPASAVENIPSRVAANH